MTIKFSNHNWVTYISNEVTEIFNCTFKIVFKKSNIKAFVLSCLCEWKGYIIHQTIFRVKFRPAACQMGRLPGKNNSSYRLQFSKFPINGEITLSGSAIPRTSGDVARPQSGCVWWHATPASWHALACHNHPAMLHWQQSS